MMAPAVVLDSNVVFDWLVFGQAAGLRVGQAIASGQVRWLVTPAMRAELAAVLARGLLDRWQPDRASLWSRWDAWAREQRAPHSQGAASRLVCRDPDDQKFVDLALASPGVRWLLSRDKAVLALARRARPLGVQICVPERWGGAEA